MLAVRAKLGVRATLRSSTSFATLSAVRASALPRVLRLSANRISVPPQSASLFPARMSHHGFGESAVRPEPDQVLKGLL
jgi:hypothetical protein